MSQGKVDGLAATYVVGVVVLDASGVGGDAVSAVGGRGRAEVAEGHAVTGGDGAGLHALVVGQVGYGDEVTVLDGGRAFAEGVAEQVCVHAAGLHERVSDGDGAAALHLSDEAAIAGCVTVGVKDTVKDAALDGGASAYRADESAVVVVLVAIIEIHRTTAVGEGQCALRIHHDAAIGDKGATSITCDVQVLNGGILDVPERRLAADGHRVATAVEGSLERV